MKQALSVVDTTAAAELTEVGPPEGEHLVEGAHGASVRRQVPQEAAVEDLEVGREENLQPPEDCLFVIVADVEPAPVAVAWGKGAGVPRRGPQRD